MRFKIHLNQRLGLGSYGKFRCDESLERKESMIKIILHKGVVLYDCRYRFDVLIITVIFDTNTLIEYLF